MNKVLVIVDFQKDFYDKNKGSLYVNGAEDVVNNICDEIVNGGYNSIVLTLDWHIYEDTSFKDNGGIWPIHCIQHSAGSSIHPDILKTIGEHKIIHDFFYKGNFYNHEEYGAFEEVDIMNNDTVALNNYMGNSELYFEADTEFTVCGLAGDYCVWETYCRLKEHGLNAKPFYGGIAFIGENFDYEEKWNIKNK